MQQRAEEKWIDCFERVFALSGVTSGDLVGVLSESLSRPVLIELAERGLQRLGARTFHLQVPSPAHTTPVPVRSTGSTTAFEGYDDLLAGLGHCSLVIDCTVEGLLHAKERDVLLQAGTRVFMISNEHPEILERCMPDPALQPRVDQALARLSAAKKMLVTSAAGTELEINITDAPVRGGAGYLQAQDKVAYWPAGLCLCFPLEHSVNGTVVLDVGDVNLTFKRYLESTVTLRIEDDHVRAIEGDGLDAELMRSYYAGWNDPLAYTVSHVGWGLNPGARWDALLMYDKDQTNGTELRALEGSFLFSTGANDFAGRYTGCHFDLPMRNCTVRLDNETVVEAGELVNALSVKKG
jgi:2,5-dihydroxypyridine 5,6-dioxygenase